MAVVNGSKLFLKRWVTIFRCDMAVMHKALGLRYILISKNFSNVARRLEAKSSSSQRWLQRQLKDPYIERARAENYRCRSAFKLMEIDDRHKILLPGSIVIDCGAAPGSWTQVAVKRLQGKGKLISIDLQPIEAVAGATIFDESDFTTKETQDKILYHLGGRHADVVMSDMAPRASGVKSLDHDRITDLCLHTIKFSSTVLKKGGSVLCKLWQGNQQARLEHIMKQLFSSVKVLKPKASRSDSAEIFLLGKNFNGMRPPTTR